LTGLKKNLDLSTESKKLLVERDHEHLSVSRQCKLLGLNRSSLYYEPTCESELNLELMRVIDEVHTEHPYFGSPRMTAWLRREGYEVNQKRIERLMHRMMIIAVYPRKRLDLSSPGHRKFPYLLRGVEAQRPNHIWRADITYIRMRHGFMYLCAILDLFSRYVLSWELSNTLDADFCVSTLERALAIAVPEISNTDQGSQFGSEDWVSLLMKHNVAISMDGRGRAFDNIFVERLWRTVKYEEVYLKDYSGGINAKESLAGYFRFYNGRRPHQALGYKTPVEVYAGVA
jgi:putative transposase